MTQLSPPIITYPEVIDFFSTNIDDISIQGTVELQTTRVFAKINGVSLPAPFIDSGITSGCLLYFLSGLNVPTSPYVIDKVVDGNTLILTSEPYYKEEPIQFRIRNSIDTITLMEGEDLSTLQETGTDPKQIKLVRKKYDAKLTTSTENPTRLIFTLTSLPLNIEGKNLVDIYAYTDNVLYTLTPTSNPKTIEINLKRDKFNLVISQPTGVYIRRYKDKLDVLNVENPETDVIIGYNYYFSFNAGGGLEGYSRLNDTPINTPLEQKEFKTTLGTEVETSGTNKTTTISEEVITRNIFGYTFEIPGNVINNEYNPRCFFVITAVGFDKTTGELVESSYSSEISGEPVYFGVPVTDLIVRNAEDVVTTNIDRILTVNNEIDTKPHSVVRDIFIDPPSVEFERLYVVEDFIHRSQSFITLLELDDPNDTGESIAVQDSEFKKQLGIALLLNDDQVQNLIDEQFDKLAGNTNVFRLGSQVATGTVIFYTNKIPTSKIIIPSGTSLRTEGSAVTVTITFITTSTVEFDPQNISGLYNILTGRYEISAPIKSVVPGSSGNVPANTIKIGGNLPSNVGVINLSATQFGQDVESNRSLAERALLAFSVDTGTGRGYERVALAIPGVEKIKVVKSGDTLMHRDWDEVRKKHIGGKVDIYVQGDNIAELTEKFVFRYSTIGDQGLTNFGERFRITKHATYPYRFAVDKSINNYVTIDHPITAVYSIRNVSRNANYDITNVSIILNGDTIELGSSVSATNTAIGLSSDDIIKVTYAFREFNSFIFTLGQPVNSITSVTGDITGTLEETEYDLVKLQDPLLEGESTLALDALQFNFSQGRPLLNPQTVLDEEHVLIGLQRDTLKKLGITDTSSIIVKDRRSTDPGTPIIYVENIQYNVIQDGEITYIERIDTAINKIPDGGTVFIDYECGENFTVVYSTNKILTDVASVIENTRHVTADVVIKNAPQAVVDINCAVVLFPNANKILVDKLIRTNVSRLINSKKIGQSINQSDVIGVIDKTIGVDKVVVPLLKMARADGNIVYREKIQSVLFNQISYAGNISGEPVFSVWKTANPELNHPTIPTGGPSFRHKGIFINDIALEMVDDPSLVKFKKGRGYIDSVFNTTTQEWEGRIIISMFKDAENPNDSKFIFSVTYYVYNQQGPEDIIVSDIEHPVLGTFNIAFDL